MNRHVTVVGLLLQLFAIARRPPASTTDSNSVRHCFIRKHRSTHQSKADHRKVIHQRPQLAVL